MEWPFAFALALALAFALVVWDFSFDCESVTDDVSDDVTPAAVTGTDRGRFSSTETAARATD